MRLSQRPHVETLLVHVHPLFVDLHWAQPSLADTVKLHQLSNGTWLDLATITCIKVLEPCVGYTEALQCARVAVMHKDGSETLLANDYDHAVEIAASLANFVNTKTKMNLKPYNCTKCGVLEDSTFDSVTMEQMRTLQYCFDCNYWHNFKQEYLKGNSFVIQGQGFTLGPKKASALARGFWGRPFKIRGTKDPHKGIVFKTNNLWGRGLVSPYFLSELPDNAEFITYED